MPALRQILSLLTWFAVVAATGACSVSEPVSPLGTCAAVTFADSSPVAHGRAEVDRALADAGQSTPVHLYLADAGCGVPLLSRARIQLSAAAESFAIFADPSGTVVVGRDEVGAMYGALEVAERLRGGDAVPPAQPIVRTPAMPIRAGNLFLPIPAAGETTWWFLDEGFWREYLDMLARGRFNILDMHGMFGFATSLFPNALLYFGTSKSFPDVGVSLADRERNLAMLKRVVDMASARGIKTGLMTYRSDLTVDGVTPGPVLTDAELATYTREATTDLAVHVPTLWRFGFRIWESTHDASFYPDTIIAGLKDSGTKIGVYSRSWGVGKGSMIDVLDAAGGDLIVEVKYNGEQLGPPYVVTGGMMSQKAWWNFSYADYLDPPAPYTFVFQIRSGGTHRMLRHASYDRIKRAVKGALLGSSQGISFEAPHAFFPARDDYHVSPDDRFSPWTFRRDELMYLMFGRLSYDFDTPDTVFRQALRERTGTDAFWAPLQAASDVVPWIQSVHMCGPDQRHFAPDLEWAGTVGYWASPATTVHPNSPCPTDYHGPLDTLAFTTPFEAAQDLLAGEGTSRVSPIDVASIVLHDAAAARAAAQVSFDPANAEARDFARECAALADLGDYFGHKLKAATALAVYGGSRAPDYLDAARAETALADAAWTALAGHTAHIAPFLEMMKMVLIGYPTYHWSMMLPHLAEDPASIDQYVADAASRPVPTVRLGLPPAATFLDAVRPAGPGLLSLVADQPQGKKQAVTARFGRDLPDSARVRVWWKAFSGFADWSTAHAKRVDAHTFRAQIDKGDNAGYFAVEILDGPGASFRYPDPLVGPPYVAVPP
jgi:hypothetical protein